MGFHVGFDRKSTYVDGWPLGKYHFLFCQRKTTDKVSQLGTTVVGSSILTAYPASDGARVAGFFLVACGYVTAVTWVSTFLDLLNDRFG